MSNTEINQPTVGQIVHYYPVIPNEFGIPDLPQSLYAAIVVETRELVVHLCWFSTSGCESKVFVPHRSLANINQSFWDYLPL